LILHYAGNGSGRSGGLPLLLNAADSGLDLGEALPILFEETMDAGNFASWTIVIDGRKTNRKVGCSDGRITILPPGLVILVK
jgi:hypothetical protein